jgi:hypothetical protein
MFSSQTMRVALFGTIGIACAYAWYWATSGTFVCVKGTIDEPLQKTVSTLDGAVELGIKLSISLVAAGAAPLVGFTTGVRLTPWTKSLLLIAVLLFGQSAMAGVWWKLRVANSWMNECLNLVSEDLIQRVFEAAFYFFSAGLICALVMLCVAAWSRK